MILIGSKAIKFWFPEFNRELKDIDYATSVENITNKEKGVEYLYNPILVKWCNSSEVANPDELYTLKLSHVIGWDLKNGSFNKHLWDINFLKERGAKLIKPLFYQLYDFWKGVHGPNKRSDLEMTSEEFFDNALKCEYSHDWLHILLQDPPTYTKVLKGDKEVEVDEDKFNNLSFKEKLDLVYEEIELMSYERWPNIDYRFAYSRMAKKFLIEHAPIWEAIFIAENWKILHKYRRNHFELLNEKIKEYGNKAVKRTFKRSTEPQYQET